MYHKSGRVRKAWQHDASVIAPTIVEEEYYRNINLGWKWTAPYLTVRSVPGTLG